MENASEIGESLGCSAGESWALRFDVSSHGVEGRVSQRLENLLTSLSSSCTALQHEVGHSFLLKKIVCEKSCKSFGKNDEDDWFWGPLGLDAGLKLGQLAIELDLDARQLLSLMERFCQAFSRGFITAVNQHQASQFFPSALLDTEVNEAIKLIISLTGWQLMSDDKCANNDNLKRVALASLNIYNEDSGKKESTDNESTQKNNGESCINLFQKLHDTSCVEGKIKTRLYLVAKLPQLGKSKTRLATTIGEESATDFARCCIGDLVDAFGCDELQHEMAQTLGDVVVSSPGVVVEVEHVILFTPMEHQTAYQAFLTSECPDTAHKWRLQPLHADTTRNGNLGDALSRAFTSAKEDGCQAVGFIGMDTPDLSVKQVGQSLAACATSMEPSAHIFPASDGGFVFLGVSCRACTVASSLFSDVLWSSHATFATQTRALCRAGLRVSIGNVYSDIDVIEDYTAFGERVDSLNLKRLTCHFKH